MLVPTMTTAEMVADARKDHKALWNKVNNLLPKLRRMYLQERGTVTPTYLHPWCSPRGNEWLLHFTLRKTGPLLGTMVWSYDRADLPFGLVVQASGVTYHLENHLVQRYGQRFDRNAQPTERLRNFYMENHSYAVETQGERRPGVKRVQVGMNHGLGLGSWDLETDIINVETFVDFGHLFPEQLELMVRMDAQRAWDALTPGQQHHRLHRAKLEEERRNGTQEQQGRAA